jgi:hypothetical protein
MYARDGCVDYLDGVIVGNGIDAWSKPSDLDTSSAKEISKWAKLARSAVVEKACTPSGPKMLLISNNSRHSASRLNYTW